jgi:hypothetical protein
LDSFASEKGNYFEVHRDGMKDEQKETILHSQRSKGRKNVLTAEFKNSVGFCGVL